MVSIVALIHIVVAIFLILLVLIQDPKGGAAGGMFGGGGGSNSLLGASGATSLLGKVTRWLAALFFLLCIGMTSVIKPSSNSVLDGVAIPQKEAIEAAPESSVPAPAENKQTAPEPTPENK